MLILVFVENGYKLIIADEPFKEDITHVDLEVDAYSNQSVLIEGPSGGYPVRVYVEDSENIESYYPVTVYSFKESENRFISCFESDTKVDQKLESDPEECISVAEVFTDHILIGYVDVSNIDYLYINNSGPVDIKIIEGPQLSMQFLQDTFYEDLAVRLSLTGGYYILIFFILALPTLVWLHFFPEDSKD